MKKYELTESHGTLWRIRALRYIPRYGVRPGDLGGWVEAENNLSQEGNCWVEENAKVSGDAWVYGDAHISQNAFVNSAQDLLIVGPIGSRKACTTFYRAVGGIWVCCGCFNGSVEDFETAVKEKHGNSQNARVYLAAIELAKVQIWGMSMNYNEENAVQHGWWQNIPDHRTTLTTQVRARTKGEG